MRNDKIKITITAILVIAYLETLAILKGIDGYLFGLVIAVISGLAGYKIKTLKDKIS